MPSSWHLCAIVQLRGPPTVWSHFANMMISLTPLKLLNLAQLALISRLVLNNKNPSAEFPTEASDKMSHQKGKGNVMIFVGKHTIQLSPDGPTDQSGSLANQHQSNDSRAERQNYVSTKPLPRPNRYLSRPLNQSVRTAKLPPLSSQIVHGHHQHTSSRKISRSQQEHGSKNIFYLPYSTKSNKIQFFDFDPNFEAENSSVPERSAPAEESTANTNLQVWPLLSGLLQGKSPPNQSPATDQTVDKLAEGEWLVGKWLHNILHRQLQSSDMDKEEKEP